MTGLLPKVADRVQETTNTTGTGALTLAGAAGPQQSFINGIGLGVLTSYAILSGDNVGWEINTGTLSGSGPYVLSRGTPSASSNAGSLVALSGVSTVFCDISAAFVGLLQTTFENNGTVQNVNTLNVSNGLTANVTGQVMTLTSAGGVVYQSGTVAQAVGTIEVGTGISASVTSGILTLTTVGQQPYDIIAFNPGTLSASQILYRAEMVRNVVLPASLTGSVASSGVSATAAATLTIANNGTSLGTVNFAASSTSGTFTFASAVTLVSSNILTITNQATADATLANVSITLTGMR